MVSLIRLLWGQILEWFHNFWVFVSPWCDGLRGHVHSGYQVLKRKSVHILKAIGIIITIAFAGASLYYAKAAADDARCQKELTQRQYCESQPTDKETPQSCEEILSRDMASFVSCRAPRTTRELIISMSGIYIQQTSRCGDSLYSTPPWWHSWGGLYSTGGFRPILWRLPDVYWMLRHVSWPVDVCLLVAASLAVLSTVIGPKGRRKPIVIPTSLLFLVMPLLFLSWIEGEELRRQARYWRRRMDVQHCLRALAASGKNAEFPFWQSRQRCMVDWDKTNWSLDEWMVRALLGIQSAKFWELFERPSRYIHSMGVMDFDYWLLPFMLRRKRR